MEWLGEIQTLIGVEGHSSASQVVDLAFNSIHANRTLVRKKIIIVKSLTAPSVYSLI